MPKVTRTKWTDVEYANYPTEEWWELHAALTLHQWLRQVETMLDVFGPTTLLGWQKKSLTVTTQLRLTEARNA